MIKTPAALRGIAYPFDGSVRSTLSYKTRESVLTTSLTNIVCTRKGERPMNPDFGCDIIDRLFDPIDSEFAGDVAYDIIDAIQKFEPRVRVISVDVTRGSVAGQVRITCIIYYVNDPSQKEIAVDINLDTRILV